MPIFTQISPQQEEDLKAKLKNQLFYSPEQNLAGILKSRLNKGIKTQKFHFIALCNENKIFLYDGMRRPFGQSSKTNRGLAGLHRLAVQMFTTAGKNQEQRNGGFMFDLYIGLRRIDLTLDVDVEKLEER